MVGPHLVHPRVRSQFSTVAIILWLVVSMGTAAAGEGPTIVVDPPDAHPGETISIEGSGFQPQEEIEIQFRGVVIATATADDHGAFSATGIVPEPVHEVDRLFAIGALGSSAEVDYPVAPPAPTTTTSSTTTEPATTTTSTASTTTTDQTTTTTTLPPDPPPGGDNDPWWEDLPWEWLLIGGTAVGTSVYIWHKRRTTPKRSKP